MIHPGKQGMRLEHVVPGRVRFRHFGMKSNPGLAAEFHEKLSATEGVAHVETNPTTGSVIVRYRPEATGLIDMLIKITAALGLSAAHIDPKEVEEWLHVLNVRTDDLGSALAESMESLGHFMEDGLTSLTKREWNIGVVAPMVLTVLGLRSLLVCETLKTPSWYEYLWFAFGVYYTLNKPESPGDAAT